MEKDGPPLLAHLGPVLGDLAVCPAPQSAHHDPAGAELGSGGPCAQPGLFFPGLGGLLPELGHGAGRRAVLLPRGVQSGVSYGKGLRIVWPSAGKPKRIKSI